MVLDGGVHQSLKRWIGLCRRGQGQEIMAAKQMSPVDRAEALRA